MRINVPTRDKPPAYQQVGILTDANDPATIKPLYGRQTYRDPISGITLHR